MTHAAMSAKPVAAPRCPGTCPGTSDVARYLHGMNTSLLRLALLDATVSQLDEVINWLDRPWAPGKNDALRAAWHESKRSDGARRALAYAIEEEVRALPPDRDLALVSQRLGVASSVEVVATEVVRRLGGIVSWPLPVAPEIVIGALRATADIARLVLGDSGGHRSGGHRYRRGRSRYRYGR